MGKTVDLGALLLRNENIRAVGNMNVNARGDRLDSMNRVIETKNKQAQRRYDRQSNVSAGPAQTGTGVGQTSTATPEAATIQTQDTTIDTPVVDTPVVDPADTFADLPQDDPADVAQPVDAVDNTPVAIPPGGLAAAIARSKEVKQELMKTPRQLAQERGVRKI
jgi:hypothetical protein